MLKRERDQSAEQGELRIQGRPNQSTQYFLYSKATYPRTTEAMRMAGGKPSTPAPGNPQQKRG